MCIGSVNARARDSFGGGSVRDDLPHVCVLPSGPCQPGPAGEGADDEGDEDGAPVDDVREVKEEGEERERGGGANGEGDDAGAAVLRFLDGFLGRGLGGHVRLTW